MPNPCPAAIGESKAAGRGAGVVQAPAYCCPVHASPLAEEPQRLICHEGHEFAVVRRIPRFVAAEGYAESFGRQWNRFRTTQLDSRTGLRLSEERALRCIGVAGPSNGERPLADQQVLEVGCGAGRFTEILLGLGATVTSVDLSSAVAANAENFPIAERHRVAQADVRALPFAPLQFDGVFCLGAVQHTPDPEATIEALYSQVRPGGWLAFDHYAQDLSAITWLGGRLCRQRLLRMPVERRLPAVERLVDRALPLHRAVGRRSRTAGRLLSRISPVLSYYHVHPQLTEELQHEWAVLDTHDALTDTFKHHRPPSAVRCHLEALGLVEIEVWLAGNGIEARGRRPVDGKP